MPPSSHGLSRGSATPPGRGVVVEEAPDRSDAGRCRETEAEKAERAEGKRPTCQAARPRSEREKAAAKEAGKKTTAKKSPLTAREGAPREKGPSNADLASVVSARCHRE